LEEALVAATRGVWNPEAIRDQLDKGIAALHDAQLKVTAFQRRLS
jgi:hypothetical protein